MQYLQPNDANREHIVKAAFAEWDHRIAPVFDVARRISVIEAEAGQIQNRAQADLTGAFPAQRVLKLVELGIETLVCGAISRPLYLMVGARGIRVIPFVSGDLENVIQAWLENRLAETAYSMPGCRGCFRGGRLEDDADTISEEIAMRGMNRPGMGPGRGQGRGGAGTGQGRGQGGGRGRGGSGGGRGVGGGRGGGGNPAAAGPGGNCACPACGHVEPHEPGTPCLQKACPKCGTAMTRE